MNDGRGVEQGVEGVLLVLVLLDLGGQGDVGRAVECRTRRIEEAIAEARAGRVRRGGVDVVVGHLDVGVAAVLAEHRDVLRLEFAREVAQGAWLRHRVAEDVGQRRTGLLLRLGVLHEAVRLELDGRGEG